MRFFLRSKIHNAVVTEARLDYMGSVTIDADLMRKADIAENEKVLVVNLANGNRLETYAIRGPAGSGVVCANGAAAHLFKRGDGAILMTFQASARAPRPRVVLVDGRNRFVRYLKEVPGPAPRVR